MEQVMIITIARQCGCQGDEIGLRLAQEYGLKLYNKEHIIKLAKEKNIYDKFPYFFSEIPVNALMHTISDDEGNILLTESKKALNPLIGDENCVIIGRCANYAFSDRQDKVSIFLSGDKTARIRHISQKHNITEKKAKIVVEETDSRRREFHKYCSNQEWGNAAYYDLCIDEVKTGVEGAVKLIKEYISTINQK